MALRKSRHIFGELKWSRVRNRHLDNYKQFLDCFFALNNTGYAHFHALIIDTNQLDHDKFGCDAEIGFYKFYYQLLLHCFGAKYCQKDPSNRLLVYTDYRTSSYSLTELRKILNNGISKRFNITTSPFRLIQPCNSALSQSIQMVDVLIGAIGYKKNGYNLLANANPAKKELVTYIAEKSGTDLVNGTPLRIQRFTIWNFRLQNKTAPPNPTAACAATVTGFPHSKRGFSDMSGAAN